MKKRILTVKEVKTRISKIEYGINVGVVVP